MMPTTPNRACEGLIDDAEQGLSTFPQARQAEREQNGEKQHLEDLARGERAHHRVGNDVHQELERALLLGLGNEALDRFGVDGGGVDIHADARLQRVGDNQPDDQRQRRDHLEIDERLEAHASDLAHVLHAGDAVHHRAEDDGCDHHLDHLDEGIAERLHLLAELRVEMAEQHAHQDGREHLEIQALEERLVLGKRSCARRLSLHGFTPCRSSLALNARVDDGTRRHVAQR